MKLESSLPERVGFLHAVPIFDLLVLLLVFLLLGSSFLSQSGVEVELPISRYQVDRHENIATISITPGDPPVIWLERQRVERRDLVEELSKRHNDSVRIYIRSDEKIPAGYERQVAELVLQEGFRVYLLGRKKELGFD